MKNRAGKTNEKSSYIEAAGKASCLLYAQDGRHATFFIRILGPEIFFTIFDRGGSLSTCGYNIHQFPRTFLRILIGISCASLSTLGFDKSIRWQQVQRDDRVVQVKEVQFVKDGLVYVIELISILFISDNPHGRGTTVWKGVKMRKKWRNWGKQNVVVKDSWIDPLRKYTEGKILSILNDHGIEGVPKLIHEQQIKTFHPTIPGKTVNSSTHFLRAPLAHRERGSYYLRVLSRIITEPVGDLITEFSCLGELLVAFLDYVIGKL